MHKPPAAKGSGWFVCGDLLERCQCSIPTRCWCAPWLCTLAFIEIASVRHIVVDIFKIEAELIGAVFVVIRIDLHYPCVSIINKSTKNWSISQCVPECRFTARNLDHDWYVGKVLTYNCLRISRGSDNYRRFMFDLPIGGSSLFNCTHSRYSNNCCDQGGYNKPSVLSNKLTSECRANPKVYRSLQAWRMKVNFYSVRERWPQSCFKLCLTERMKFIWIDIHTHFTGKCRLRYYLLPT